MSWRSGGVGKIDGTLLGKSGESRGSREETPQRVPSKNQGISSILKQVANPLISD
jgi:hypothetical protein